MSGYVFGKERLEIIEEALKQRGRPKNGGKTGKRVALRLASGEEIEGTVTIVGNFLVHISKLSGKEFYDAVVSIDKISAVRMKMRDK